MGVIQAQGVNQGTWWAGKSGIGSAHRPSQYCPSHLRGAKTRAQGFIAPVYLILAHVDLTLAVEQKCGCLSSH